MLDWLRRHGVDEVLLSCGFRSDDVSACSATSTAACACATWSRTSRSAPPARCGSRRRGRARGPRARPERRLPHRHRPHRRARAARGDERRGHARARRRRRHVLLRRRANARGRPGGGVPREAPRPGAHEPDQRRRVRARARAWWRWCRRRPRRLDRARGVPGARRRGALRLPPDGYWIDIGTPERYLEATYDLLAGRVESELPPRDETGSLVYDGCITSGARIGPLSVLGRHCSVGDHSVVERSVLHDSVRVGHECEILESVLAEGARVEDGARIGPDAVVGGGRGRRAGRRGGARRADRARRARRDESVEDVLASPSQSATRSGGSSRPGIRQGICPAAWRCAAPAAAVTRAAALGDRADAPVRDVRGPELEPGPATTRSSCARATAATTRRRSRASRTPARAGTGARRVHHGGTAGQPRPRGACR